MNERIKIVPGSHAEWDDEIEFSSYVGYTVSIEQLYQAFKARMELERHKPTCCLRTGEWSECDCGYVPTNVEKL